MEQLKFELHLSIGYVNADREEIITLDDLGFELEQWEALSERERENVLSDYAEDWASNYIEISAYPQD